MSESDVKNLKIEIATSLSISSCFFKFINHHYHDQTLASSSGLTWLDQTNKNRWPVKPSQWVPRSEDSHETIVRLSKMSNGHPKKRFTLHLRSHDIDLIASHIATIQFELQIRIIRYN